MTQPNRPLHNYSQANDKATEMKSLSAVMAKAVQHGYLESFVVTVAGMTSPAAPGHAYQPKEVSVVNFYRFEGESDPGDECILYQIETNDGHKGMLIDAYGAYADELTTAFMQQVEAIQKRA